LKDRVYITEVEIRKLLKKFASHSDQTNVEAITLSDKEHLMKLLKAQYRELYELLLRIATNRLSAPAFSRKFVLSLASTSPICSYIPLSALHLLDRVAAGEDLRSFPSAWLLLQETAPVVFEMIVTCELEHLPHEFRSLLRLLIDKVNVMFDLCQPIQCDEVPSGDNDESSFFPSLPMLRNRGYYEGDTVRGNTDVTCGKNFRGHPTLLPGIFTIYCSHGELI
jgi:hypothetical protein